MRSILFKKRLVIAMLSIMILGTASTTFAKLSFNDLHEVSWAQPVIEKWLEQGFIIGYEDGTFKPNKHITRAEFATLIYRVFELEDIQEKNFSDVPSDTWYARAIYTLAAKGIAEGYEDGTFRPNDRITRAEAAAMIVNVKRLAENEAAANIFTDAKQIPGWAKGSVGSAVEAGFMCGYPDGTFKPNEKITRAEAVSALERGRNLQSEILPVEKKYAINMTYNKLISVSQEIPAGTTVITSTLIKDMAEEIFSLMDIMGYKRIVIDKILNLHSKKGTNYAKQISKDILEYGGELNLYDAAYHDLKAVVDTEDAVDAGENLVEILLKADLLEVIEDFEKVYPNKSVSDIHLDFTVLIDGEVIKDQSLIEIKEILLRDLIGRSLADSLGETYIQIGENKLEFEIVEQEKKFK